MTPSTSPPSSPPPASQATPRTRPPSPRRQSRELTLQGLYQWLVNPENAAIIEAHIREQPEFEKCDEAHFKTLLYGCIDHAETLNQSLSTYIDRPLVELSPVEHASLLIGLFELKHCANIPYRVVINEAVELTKQFGGTDGHKYVNGVLDKAAVRIRPEETAMPSSSPSTVRRPRTPAAHPPLL